MIRKVFSDYAIKWKSAVRVQVLKGDKKDDKKKRFVDLPPSSICPVLPQLSGSRPGSTPKQKGSHSCKCHPRCHELAQARTTIYQPLLVQQWILELEMDWKRLCSCHTIYASSLLRPFFPCFFIIICISP